MLGIFRKKSKLDILQKEYEQLMSEWHKLSSIDRAKSDDKYEQAQKVLMQIEVLQKN